MFINCYYYAPHNHSLLRSHVCRDLRHIADLGCDAVSVCVQEDQLANWHQGRLHVFVGEAHAAGLQVHAVPNRWCGLLAGWLDGFSEWTLRHSDTWLPGRPGQSDPEHPAVAEHYREHVRRLLDFGFDGIIWDEPRPADRREVFEFLDRMSSHAKSMDPGVVISLFAEAGGLHVAPWLAECEHLDFAGADGHVRRDEYQMHRMKNTIFTTHEVFHPALKAAGKKTIFLPEAQRHRDEDLGEYVACVDEAFSLPMDHLLFYYSAHEMREAGSEDAFNEATWAAVRRLART
jgi:hypothetical protein